MNFNFEPVGDKAHDAGGFDPWNLLQLRFPLRQGHKENVAADVAAHDFHYLRAGDVLQAADFNVIARFNPESPGALAVVVKASNGQSTKKDNTESDGAPGQAGDSFPGERTTTNRDALLHPQEGRFLLHVQVEQARIVHFFAPWLVGQWVQVFLRDGGTDSPRRQLRSIVAESLSKNTITAFRDER
jgi:hypothetical protein